MTDTFIVDGAGAFVVGKAQTTPDDESIGFMRSSTDALGQWGMSPEQGFPEIAAAVFSGTAMLNRVLTRGGLRVGLIVTAGQQDYLKLERGKQTFLGFSYGDRLHVNTHYHNEPLVPRSRIYGVRGRIDLNGQEVIPLLEDEVREATAALLADDVEAIVINYLFSYRNPSHELRTREIVEEEQRRIDGGTEVPIFASSQLYPVRGDFPRLNSTLLEAYAAEPSRRTLRNVSDKTNAAGAGFELRVMAAHGGTISIETNELARTLMSGPIGGVVGADFLAKQLDVKNMLCTDIGGTSFDIALITDNRFDINNHPDAARMLLSIPQVSIDTVGAGTGSYVRVDPGSNRPEFGPDSAGARIGVSWPEGGVETVTITDLNLVLGRLNADNFLGGEIKLDIERARAEIKRQIADPLGLGIEAAAAGIIELFESSLRNDAVGRILGKGYAPVDYTLLCYGGGGPLHVAGYTAGVPYDKVLVPAWAAGFSAFGCACADWEYRYDTTIDGAIPPAGEGGSIEDTVEIREAVNRAWGELEGRLEAEFAKSNVDSSNITFVHGLRMQYLGQLNDIEVKSDLKRLESDADVAATVDLFEEAYARVYARSARSPEFGWGITEAFVVGTSEIEKPVLPSHDEISAPAEPRETRPVYWVDGFVETPIHEMEDIKPGQVIDGPAILEAPATTFPVPPDRRVRLNRNNIFELEEV
jgi:N-methylhydantoinase A/acetone carboxylase beta subunit